MFTPSWTPWRSVRPMQMCACSGLKTHWWLFGLFGKMLAKAREPLQVLPADKDITHSCLLGEVPSSLLGINDEPPLQHKKRVEGPPTSFSFNFDEGHNQAYDDYALLGQQHKFAPNVRYGLRHPFANRQKSKQMDLNNNANRNLPQVKMADIKYLDHYKLDDFEEKKESHKENTPVSPPPAPRTVKQTDHQVIKKDLKDKNPKSKNSIKSCMNEFVQTDMEKGVALSDAEAPADYNLKYKAGLAQPRVSRKASEYQKQFGWKLAVPASPLLSAEQIIHNKTTQISPSKKGISTKKSEYQAQFKKYQPELSFHHGRNRNQAKRSKSVGGDEEYQELLKVFLASGRGRRPTLPEVCPTNTLLLKIFLLKEEGGKTFDECGIFLQKIFPHLPIERSRSLVVNCKKKWDKIQDREKQENFLKETFKTCSIEAVSTKSDKKLDKTRKAVPNNSVLFCSENKENSFSIRPSPCHQTFRCENDCFTCPNWKLAEKGRELAAARRCAERMNAHIMSLLEEKTFLKAEIKKLSDLDARLKAAENYSNAIELNCKAALEQLHTTEDTVQDLRKKLSYYSKQGHVKKLRRMKSKLTVVQENNKFMSCKLKTTQKKLRSIQLSHAKLKRKLQKERQKVSKLKAAQNDSEARIQDEDFSILRLKDERGHFTSSAIVCVMTLIGECEVAPSKCGIVIQTVVKHFFNCMVPDSDLPSTRSALRFADQGHVMAKLHVAEKIMDGQSWDLHTDSTSRSGKKYVGQQINIDGTTLSTGFSPVSVENTQSLVDITFNMLQELCDLYEEEEAQTKFLTMLTNLSGVMTDRASVMKCFAKQLDQEVKEMLQSEETLEFLLCNAHFLLGISYESVKALFSHEKASGQKLGRDNLPVFGRFQAASESSAARYIRTACDCLGPRGDDKNGCRDSWETYCVMTEMKSHVTSYHSNRFNNLFDAAAALHLHRTDIHAFLNSCVSKRNKKLESILADNRCDQIDCYLVALGILYFRVTGPYWQLLSAQIHYLDFFHYVEMMMALFSRWAVDPMDAFNEEFEPLFGVQFMANRDMFKALMTVPAEKKVIVLEVMKLIAARLVDVTNRQMHDFLQGGHYYNVQDQALREKMAHSKLTNLVGEKAFGDLDFSLFKRRFASLHHHSTVHMLHWNKTISVWFLCKDHEEQKRLMGISAKKALGLRRSHIQEEKDVVARRQIILETNRQKKIDAENQKRQKTVQVMDRLALHHGPCITVAQVDAMLSKCTTKKEQLQAMKAELLYHKIVLQETSPLLKVSLKLHQLVINLKIFLGADPATVTSAHLPSPSHPGSLARCHMHPSSDSEEVHLPVLHHRPGLVPKKQVNLSFSESDSDCAAEQEEEKSDSESNQGSLPNEFIPYEFHSLGDVVAVHFDDDFYIGEVVTVETVAEGEINFMEKCAIQTNAFRWPKTEDKCKVHRNFVFAHNLKLEPASSSGRMWKIENFQALANIYALYKSLFCR